MHASKKNARPLILPWYRWLWLWWVFSVQHIPEVTIVICGGLVANPFRKRISRWSHFGEEPFAKMDIWSRFLRSWFSCTDCFVPCIKDFSIIFDRCVSTPNTVYRHSRHSSRRCYVSWPNVILPTAGLPITVGQLMVGQFKQQLANYSNSWLKIATVGKY